MAKNNKNNRRYSKEEKDRLISRMLPPENVSPTKLSLETGISKSTLATWKSKVTSTTSTRNRKPTKNIYSREKFLIVMDTYTLNENDLAKYCRENGLYVEDVKQWRTSCIAANDSVKNVSDSKELVEELKEEKKRFKELSMELRIKEKALAETTALLVLRKKLNAIFGENEED